MPGSIRSELVPAPISTPVSEGILTQPAPSQKKAPEPLFMQISELATANELAESAPMAIQSETILDSLLAKMLLSAEKLVEKLLDSPFVALLVDMNQLISEGMNSLLGQWLASFFGWLLEGGKAPSPLEAPFNPVPAPPPNPPVATSSAGSSSLSKSNHSDQEAFVLLLGALASLWIPLLKGKFSYPSSELLKPGSLSRLAAERPG